MLPADSPFAALPAPGPHPATAELRAYAAGTLNSANEHRVEAHALDCERCAELLEGFSMSDAAATDQALAGLRTRLQTRVADDLTAPVLLPASRPLWPRLAAAAALLGVMAGGIWGWEQQHPATDIATAAHETAAPAAKPQPTNPAAITTAKPPQTAPRPQPAATAPTTAPSRPADYAAVRPHRRVTGSRPLRRPAQPDELVLADENTSVASTANEVASRAAPAATEETPLANRAAAPSAKKAVAAEVATAPQAVVAAAPPAISRAAADSSSTRQQQDIVGRFSKAKAFESTALVRDKPMPAVPTIAPAPAAGTPALREYLRREAAGFELDEGAKPLSGTVHLRFVVGADGQLSNLRVVRGLRADYDEEALRMVCEGPAWRPGIAGGRRTALPMELTVSF